MKEKPKILRAIITSLLTFFVFGAVYMLVYLIIGGILEILSMIPLISGLIDLLFYFRRDNPDMMLSILSPTISFFISMATQVALNKDNPTRGLSLILLGIYIMLLHIVSIPINIIYGEGILKNIVQVIVGFIFFNSGRSEIRD